MQKINYVVDVPIQLAKSLEGKYFVGFVDSLTFGEGTKAWVRLYNPIDSGVNLHVSAWTISDVSESSYTAEIWFNSMPLGTPQESKFVICANTAISPLPQPQIRLQYLSDVKGIPSEGTMAFIRRGVKSTTMVSEEQGKFIFPPGGSFMIFILNPLTPSQFASCSIAFGWWEEPISTNNIG